MGPVRGMIIILTLIASFGSFVALVALPLLLRRSLRTDRQGVRQGVRSACISLIASALREGGPVGGHEQSVVYLEQFDKTQLIVEDLLIP